MFSGALAQTVGVFKTTGPQMAEAIKNIGAIAAASNVPLQEQMAILGQLQTTMPGSEAGTLYKAFMMQVAKAGQELGLSFVDARGQLKGIVPILQELKRGFPDLSNAAAQVKLKKAFGSDEAARFLLQMSMGLDQLEGNIKSVGQAMRGGTAVTLEMARAMNMDIGSQYGLVRQQLQNLFEILGRTMLPVVIPVFQAFSRFILHLQTLAKSMPGLTRVVLTLCAALGAALVVVGAVVSAIGTVGIMLPAVKAGIAAIGPMLAGVGSAVTASFWPVVAIIAAVVIAVIALKRAWETNFAGIRDVVMGAWNKISLAFQGIRALIGSLSGGTGQMSAELAQRLQAAGLLKFVTTVFQVYYRVREFLSGLWQAFSGCFGRIRAILEPVVQSLMGAFGELGKAIGSVLAAFGLATTAADASSFKSFGQTLGTVLGVIAQVAAYVIKFIVIPLSWVIRIVAAVVQGIVWFGKSVVTAFVAAVPYVYRFSLPLRMIVQALLAVGRVAYTVWRMLTGDISVVDGLKAIGSAIFSFLATPFLWVRDVASAAWGFLRSLFSGLGGFFRSAGTALLSSLQSLPIVSTIIKLLGTIHSLVSGQINFAEAGKRILVTLAQGMWSAAAFPLEMLKRALGWLRRLLPFSDAQEGPLSSLTASGAAILRAIAQGMLSVLSLPGQVMRQAFSVVMSAGRSLISSAFQSGRSMMTTIASGIRSAMSVPYEAAKSVLSRLRRLLPFSDAREGPLSTLSRSGAAMLEAFSSGISRAARLPARAFEHALGLASQLGRSTIVPAAVAGTLALTPALAGPVPEMAGPRIVAQRVAASAVPVSPERSQLLAATRGALAPETATGTGAGSENLRPLLEAILAKLDGLADRPIDVSVTTNLDGRRIAQAVYKNMRERKVRNYESA